MELNEAVRRILGQHWMLILLVALVPVQIVAILHSVDSPAYTASARVVLDTPDPKSGAESAAIADTAKAIVTSPSEVAHAFRELRATGRDPERFAREKVQIRALGSSGVLQLTVTDTSARGAAAIANALADRLIETRLKLTRGQVQQTLSGLDRRIEQINRRISRLDTEADELVVATAQATEPERANALRGQRDEALRARDFLAQQRTVRESERVNLLSTLALRPQPSVISGARAPVEADPSGQLPDLVLAALLGVVLGVGLAGLKETLRPTLVGGEAVATELNAPLLGTLAPASPDGAGGHERGELARRLRMSAEQARVRSITLVPTRDGGSLEPLTQSLNESLGSAPSPVAVDERRADAAVFVRAFGVGDSAVHNGGATGLVVVAPSLMEKAQLTDTKHLLRVSPAPLLGVIAHERSRPASGPLRGLSAAFGRRTGSR